MRKTPLFSQIFGKSPISPIQEHMSQAAAAARLLPDFFEALILGNGDAEKVAAKIVALEEKADDIKFQVRLNLPRTLFMPVARTDLLELLQAQDKIPNRAKDIAGLAMGRQMKVPEPLAESLMEFVKKAAETPELALKALEELDELLETGFSGKEVGLISDMIERLNVVEHETDDLQRAVQKGLYARESEMNPVDVMFLYRLIEWIGDIADHSQTVGSRLLYLISK